MAEKLDFSDKKDILFHFFLVAEDVTDNICTADFQRTNIRHSYMNYVIPFLYGYILISYTYSYVIPFVCVNTILLLIVSKCQSVYYPLTRETIFNRRQSLWDTKIRPYIRLRKVQLSRKMLKALKLNVFKRFISHIFVEIW